MATLPSHLEIVTSARTERVVLRRSARARRLQIRVGADGAEIVLPKRYTLAEARAFLDERSTWVLGALDDARLKARQRQTNRDEQLPSQGVLYDGQRRPATISGAMTAHRRGSVSLSDESGSFNLRLPAGGGTEAEEIIERFLRRRARVAIERLVATWAGEMAVEPGRIFIRDQKTRWASCSGRGNLSFSWRLICLPPDVREYVVIHELAHLHHMNHSRAFWRQVVRHCPDYASHRTYLKAHGWQVREPIRLN
jgi:predicted metal-dependent hydrolase